MQKYKQVRWCCTKTFFTNNKKLYYDVSCRFHMWQVITLRGHHSPLIEKMNKYCYDKNGFKRYNDANDCESIVLGDENIVFTWTGGNLMNINRIIFHKRTPEGAF